jgi:hypothetical protein
MGTVKSLGIFPTRYRFDPRQENEDGNGLAFHRHERNWQRPKSGTVEI